MPLSEEQKKINHKIANKKYRENNRERVAAAGKKYRDNNKEVVAARKQLWTENHREHVNQKANEYYHEHKNEPHYKKQRTLSNWKRIGLKGNYEKIYEYYLKITNCQECECELGVMGDGTGRAKCMDHHHATGLFRNVLCHSCNLKRK